MPVETDGPTELSSRAPWAASDEVEAAEEPYLDEAPSIDPTTHFPIPKKPKAVITTGDLPPPAQAAHAPDDAYLEAGTMLGDYRVEGQIGEGGMGVVYAAVHPLIGKRAAVKVLKAELCRAAINVERFIDEARIVNQIGHPNIVDVFAFGQTRDGRSYFVMEWLKGESLRMRAARGRLALDEVCDVIRPLARALEAAHEQGVIHRDLKPDNIYLIDVRGEAPRVKLLDFGIAKLAREEHRMERTATGAMVGTPQYIAPEQAKGYAIDARVDIYSLGGILFELLTGRPPFVADNAMEMVAKHLMEPAPRPSTLADIPPELDELVVRMLSKHPDGRPTLAEVATVIERTSALDRTSVKMQRPRVQTPKPGRAPSPPVLNIPTPTPYSAPNLRSLPAAPSPAAIPALAKALPGALSDTVAVTDLTESIHTPSTRSGISKQGILLLTLGVVAMAAITYLVVARVNKKAEPSAAVETQVEPIGQPEPPKVRIGAIVEPAPSGSAVEQPKVEPPNTQVKVEPVKVEPVKAEPPNVQAKVEPVKVEPLPPTPTPQPTTTPVPKPTPPKPTPPKATPNVQAVPLPKETPPLVPRKPKLGRLELAITGGKGTPKITIDGVASPPAKDLPPGTHAIVVTAPGAKPVTLVVTIEEGKTAVRSVSLPEPAKDDLLAPGSLGPTKK